MPEPNEQITNPLTSKQICQIRIMFPVDSDEQAIAYKKKITDVLTEIPEAQINFSLMSMPAK
ncbi:hypothetical protein ES703_121996 [subsurface metagenome]